MIFSIPVNDGVGESLFFPYLLANVGDLWVSDSGLVCVLNEIASYSCTSFFVTWERGWEGGVMFAVP